jgi:hypothetical protein
MTMGKHVTDKMKNVTRDMYIVHCTMYNVRCTYFLNSMKLILGNCMTLPF